MNALVAVRFDVQFSAHALREIRATAKDGYSAARIEEEVVVTDKGCRVITLFPAEELPISHKY